MATTDRSDFPGQATAPTQESYDVTIIGAGVVGCAIARSFAIRGWSTLVLDKGGDIIEGASKGNSALLHTGFDEPTESLELQMIKVGFETYLRINERMNLPFVRTGALVVAWDQEQLEKLPSILELSKINGVTNAYIIDKAELHRREPGLADGALGAVVIVDEGIIDPWSAPLAYMKQALMHGARFVTRAEVKSFERVNNQWRIHSSAGSFASRLVVNAAGLFGDRVELMAGREPGFTVRPRKGQFVVYDKPAHDLVNAIILRVPTHRTKGVLLSRTIYGNLLLGPTADDQDDRVHAAVDVESLKRIIGEGETMLPALAGQTVTATFAGLRPATEHRDFQLKADSDMNWITVGGIRSTGLSASLGLGEWAATQGSAILGDPRQAPADDDLEWPVMTNLAASRERPYQTEGRSRIVCHCEWVTENEIVEALNGDLPARTLGGLKRRTRVMMGRCQGFGCSGAVRRLAPHLVGLDEQAPTPSHTTSLPEAAE